MRRVVFFELPQAHLDLLLRAREDAECDVAGVLAREDSAVSLRLADLLGLPHGVLPAFGLPECDVIVAGNVKDAPSGPGMRVVDSGTAFDDWTSVLAPESAPAAPTAKNGRDGAPAPAASGGGPSKQRRDGAPAQQPHREGGPASPPQRDGGSASPPQRDGGGSRPQQRASRGEVHASPRPAHGETPVSHPAWRRVHPIERDPLDLAAVTLRPHALAGWLLSEACREAHASAGVFLPAGGREGLVFEPSDLSLDAETLASWSSLPRVEEALIGGAVLVLLDEELKPADGHGPMSGVLVPFGDGGPFRAALLVRSGERFRTTELERLEDWCRRAGTLLSRATDTWQAVRASRQRAARDSMEQVISASSGVEAIEAAAGAIADAMGASRAGLWMERGPNINGAGAGSAAWAGQVLAKGRVRRYECQDGPTADGEKTWIVVIPVANGHYRGAAVLEDLVIVPDELETAIDEAGALAAWALDAIGLRDQG